MLSILAALLSGIAVDVLATLVFHYTAQNKAIPAATANVAVTACIIYNFVDITRDPYISIPYLTGIWIGGLIGVKLKVKLETMEKQKCNKQKQSLQSS